ncbi:MAG: tRNA lysidine(34) synthetase TilS [Dissulfurispiraceae bacterium]
MDIIAKTKDTILKHSMLSHGDGVLAGLSGGPDSVCLLVVLHSLREHFGMNLYAAYVEHGLRPEETPAEIFFCEKLCLSLNVSFSVKSVDVKSFAKAQGLNKQEAARELRYKALNEAAHTAGAAKIALGHTADDQAETVIMRLLRGAGTLGLSGIPPVRKNIIRPIIGVERKEIERFLETQKIGFLVDSSNLEDKYMRNKIRRTVMPALKDLGPDMTITIGRTADICREEDDYLELQTTKALMKLISRKTDTAIELFILPIERMDKALVRRIIRRAVRAVEGLRGIGFIHIEALLDLVKSGHSGDRLYLPRGVRAIKGYSTLTISSDHPAALETHIIEGPGDVFIRETSVVLSCTSIDIREPTPTNAPFAGGEFEGGDGRQKAVFDAGKLRFPLQIRSRRPGDYFYPSGFGKKKKIQDYFVDEKVPRDLRDSIPLLLSDKEIVWVVGYRADERYRIDKNTVEALKFTIRAL